MFDNGVLQGSALVILKNTCSYFCSYLDGHKRGFGIEYLPQATKGHVDNKKKASDVGGWASYIGEYYGNERHGQGARYYKKSGKVFVGRWEGGKKMEGELYSLSNNNTHSLSGYKRINNVLMVEEDQGMVKVSLNAC